MKLSDTELIALIDVALIAMTVKIIAGIVIALWNDPRWNAPRRKK